MVDSPCSHKKMQQGGPVMVQGDQIQQPQTVRGETSYGGGINAVIVGVTLKLSHSHPLEQAEKFYFANSKDLCLQTQFSGTDHRLCILPTIYELT